MKHHRLSSKHFCLHFDSPALVSLRRFKLISSSQRPSQRGGCMDDELDSISRREAASVSGTSFDPSLDLSSLDRLSSSFTFSDSASLAVIPASIRLDGILDKAAALGVVVEGRDVSVDETDADESFSSDQRNRVTAIEKLFEALLDRVKRLERELVVKQTEHEAAISMKEQEHGLLVTQLIEYKMDWATHREKIEAMERDARKSAAELIDLRGQLAEMQRNKTPTTSISTLISNKLSGRSDSMRRDTFT